MVSVYAVLFAAAVLALRRTARRQPVAGAGDDHWRLLALAPMLVVVVGSFVSLPLLLAIVALGRLV
jgi:hypothetical protein